MRNVGTNGWIINYQCNDGLFFVEPDRTLSSSRTYTCSPGNTFSPAAPPACQGTWVNTFCCDVNCQMIASTQRFSGISLTRAKRDSINRKFECVLCLFSAPQDGLWVYTQEVTYCATGGSPTNVNNDACAQMYEATLRANLAAAMGIGDTEDVFPRPFVNCRSLLDSGISQFRIVESQTFLRPPSVADVAGCFPNSSPQSAVSLRMMKFASCHGEQV